MSKYEITVPVEYVEGHLNYGYLEGVVDIPDDKLNDSEYLKKAIRNSCQLIVDDYDVYSYGDIELEYLEMTKLKEEPDDEKTKL